MSKIEDLIKQYCPNGVECRKLVDITNILYGYPFNSKLFTEDDRYIPLIRIRDIKEGRSTTYYKGEILKNYIIKKGDILVGMDGEFNLGKWNSKDALLNQRTLKISTQNCSIVLNGYLFHILKPLFKNIEKSINGSTVKHLSDKAIKRIKIPVPPMTVQEEIVKILDSYSELEAELETKLGAELDARKKQYEYHLNQLLSFEEQDKNVKFMQLGEIGTFIKGNGLQKKDFTDSGVGCIHYGQIYTYYGTYTQQTKSFVSDELAKKLKKAQKGDLIIATTSENVEDVGKAVAWLGNESICIGGHSTVFHHNQNPKYMAYLFQTEIFFKQKQKVAKGVKVIDISDKAMSKFKFGFPSIEEQERIVSILDEFNKLTNEISDSLQAEITARKKQYEYYRNKLLTFKEAV